MVKIRWLVVLICLLAVLGSSGWATVMPSGSLQWVKGQGWVGLRVSGPDPDGSAVQPAPLAEGQGSILFKTASGETEWIASGDYSGDCVTNTGQRVKVSWDASISGARVSVVPDGWTAENITLVWKAEKGEDFFGGGEVWSGSVNQRGKTVRMWVKNGTPDQCCYVPFFFSSRGYGVYVESHEHGLIHFATPEYPDKVVLTFDTKDSQGLVFHCIHERRPSKMIDCYTAITGRPPLPPKWSFLPWKWRDKHEGWHEVFEDAEGRPSNDVPG